jgi:O-antigen/teichoic acid export membrane protein
MLEILKAFLKATSGTFINILLGGISIKILASILGPEGFGLFSFLRQIQLTALMSAGGGQNALVQGGTSQEGVARQNYLQTVLIFSLLSGFLLAAGIFLFAPLIASRLIGQADSATIWAVRLLAVPVFLSVLTGYANGVQNVYRELGQMAIAQIIGALASVLLVYPAALLAQQGQKIFLPLWMIALQFSTLAASAFFLWKRRHLVQILTDLWQGYTQAAIVYFLRFAGVTTITTLLGNFVILLIRSFIEETQGLGAVGIFEASWMLSVTYISLIAMSFGSYYLPTLSALQTREERTILVRRMFHFVTLAAVPLIVGLIILKPLAIQVLYSQEYSLSLTLLRWTLIGDYFKITSWVFAYIMVASADIRMMFWSEVLWNGCLLLGSIYALKYFSSLEGIGISFSLLYLGYLIFAVSYAKVKHKIGLQRNLILTWCLGLVIIVLASWQSWNAREPNNWRMIIAWCLVSGLYLILALGIQGRRQAYSYLVKA